MAEEKAAAMAAEAAKAVPGLSKPIEEGSPLQAIDQAVAEGAAA